MNEVQVFTNQRFGEIRTIEENGRVLFCGSDVAKALGYSDTPKAIKNHCKIDGWAIYPVTDSLGRTQQAKFINEGNLYRLITHSKLPSAEQFESWVFDEVLPTIRKTGSYITDSQPTNHCTYNNRPVATLRQIAEHAGVGLHAVQRQFARHKDKFIYGTEYEMLYGCTMEHFKAQNPAYHNIQRLTVFTKEGTRKMLEYCKRCQPINEIPIANTNTQGNEKKKKLTDVMNQRLMSIHTLVDMVTHSENPQDTYCFAKTLDMLILSMYSKTLKLEEICQAK